MGNYLFILEGEKDEPKFLNSLFREMEKDDRQRCYFFRCNLHVLANLLMPDVDDDLDGIDLLMALKGRDNSDEEAKVLSYRYTDVFLVFDFEPQEDKPAFEKIRKMVVNGKYICRLLQLEKHLQRSRCQGQPFQNVYDFTDCCCHVC